MSHKLITQEAVKQYEELRQLGPTNMLDVNGVCNYANLLEMYDLAELAENRKEYIYFLMNYSHYMARYNIVQPKQGT